MVEADRTFYTVTMARMMADQGCLARSAEIYRYLLRRNPQREDLVEALAHVEAELAAKDPYELVAPLTEWAELTLAVGRLDRLVKLRNCLKRRHAHRSAGAGDPDATA